MAADPTLVQGAGMAVKRFERPLTFSKGIQAIQKSLAEGMEDVAGWYRKQKDVFNEKIQEGLDYGEDLTPDQYEVYLNKFEKLGNKYIFSGPKGKALIMQDLNRDITTMEKNKELKTNIKNTAQLSELEGGYVEGFGSSLVGIDVAGITNGSNPLVTENEDGTGESGYMIHDDSVLPELQNTYNELLALPTGEMNEKELEEHNKNVEDLKGKVESGWSKKFMKFSDIEKIINNNVKDNTFSTSILDEANNQYTYSKGLAYGTNEKYDNVAGQNTVYAWMQKGNKNSMLNHALGSDVSFRDGLTQAIQTMTYTEAGIMVDHDSDPATPDVNIEDAFGEGIAVDMDNDGLVTEVDINIIKADAAGIVDELIKNDDPALWSRGGYVNTFFNNFLNQQFERGVGARNQTVEGRKADILLGQSDEEFTKTQINTKKNSGVTSWADSPLNPDSPNYTGETTTKNKVDISADAARYKKLNLEDVKHYSLKQRWTLYKSILSDPNIPLEEKQAFMKAHGLQTRKEAGVASWTRSKKYRNTWVGLDDSYSYQQWADYQDAQARVNEEK